MYTIGELGKRVSLSRSTLLYYERVGLLLASSRSPAGYRLYDEADLTHVERIKMYRSTGLSIERICALLNDSSPDCITQALEEQLKALNQEMQLLREQQRTIVALLGQADYLTQARFLDKERWVALLREVGLDDAAMYRWHQAFEERMPEAHQDFLESLGLDVSEIDHIRRWRGGEDLT